MAATSRQESDTEEDIMKVVPAKYITTDCRRKMSVVLDGRCDLEDRDYRYFAERNGLLPEIWQVCVCIVCNILLHLSTGDTTNSENMARRL